MLIVRILNGPQGFGKRQSGFALISVLWALAALSLIAAIVLSMSMSARETSSFVRDQTEARALGEAGINRAILALLEERPELRWRVDGHPNQFDFAGTTLSVSIQDEYGKLDLNAADGILLQRFFAGVGMAEADTENLVQRVVLWRSKSLAAEPAIVLAKENFRPRFGPLQSVDELKLVEGMTDELYERAAPYLTVYAQKQYVNNATAPEELRRVLGIDANAGALANGAIVDGSIRPGIPLTNWPFAIRARVPMPSGIVYETEVVVRFTDNPKQPFWVHSWRDGVAP